MLTIWGRANSINVMKLLWLCDELELAPRRIDAGGAFGRVRDPDYLAMNPNGRVPVLDDDGTVLWESNTCLRYLCNRHAPGHAIYPSDPAARADVERWMDWQLSTLQAPMTTLFWTWVRTPPDQRDLAAAARARADAQVLWALLDSRMADHRAYLTGPFSLADITLGGFLHRWRELPIERDPAPALDAWYARLSAHAGFHAHVAVPMT